ncbi:FAD-dependent oxidoreductase [Bacillus sp. N9]
MYGGSPAGITAAIQIARMGLTVAIVEFSNHIGRMTTSGLGATDLGAEAAVGGLAKESSSHIAYGSIRMEPVFMILGQAAGAAAALAIKEKLSVQKVDYEQLKEELLRGGQVLAWTDEMEDDPIKRMEATFGKE